MTEKQLYKAAVISGLTAGGGLKTPDTYLLKQVNEIATAYCEAEPIDDRDNTVAPGRILISDERLRQLKLGYTAEHDEAQGLHLLNKTHIRFKKLINKKRTTLLDGKGFAIDTEIAELVKVGALIAANVDRLLRIKAVLQK